MNLEVEENDPHVVTCRAPDCDENASHRIETGFGEVLVCEEHFDEHSEITTGVVWKEVLPRMRDICEELDAQEEESSDDEEEDSPFAYEEEPVRLYIGTVFAWHPSGKFYTPFANSNVCDYEAALDEAWSDLMENECDAHHCWLENGEGDPCDLFICASRETARKFLLLDGIQP